MAIPALFTSGDPLADIAEFGATIQTYGEYAAAAGAAVGAVSYLAKEGASAVSTVSKFGGPEVSLLTGVVGTFLSALATLGKLAFIIGLMMIVEGAVLHYVFPAIPGIIMMIAIVGWLFLVVELMVASVLWAAAHVYAEGEGFAPPQAQYGYSAALGIIFRPLLLTMGFIFAFFIIDIGGWFLGDALQAFLTGMGGAHVGLVGFVSMLAVIIATVMLFLKTVLKLITHLADRAPQWIGGHGGQGMGEADIAQGAVSNAGGGAAKYGMYAGEKLSSGASMMSGAQAIRKQGQAAATEKAAKEQAALAAQAAKTNDSGSAAEKPEENQGKIHGEKGNNDTVSHDV